MFGHDHHAEDIAVRIDHLMAAVLVADDAERLERLARYVAPDFVYVSPDAVFEGPGGLGEAFARIRRDDRWHAAVRRTSPVDLHHGYFRYTWERMERGVVAMEGWGFGCLDEVGVHQPGRRVRGIGARSPRRPIMRARRTRRER